MVMTIMFLCAAIVAGGEAQRISQLEWQLVNDPARVHAVAALAECNYAMEARRVSHGH
jgi:hypothetical protein